MTDRESKVLAQKEKDWQPLMNKLSPQARRNRRRRINKRIRRLKKVGIE